jgi:hypothetical protein
MWRVICNLDGWKLESEISARRLCVGGKVLMNRRLKFLTVCLLLLVSGACKKSEPVNSSVAPTAPPASVEPVPSFSSAQKIGLFVYAKNNQSRDQQLVDEYACYDDVQKQTGIDPEAPGPAALSSAQVQAAGQAAAANAPQAEGGRLRGAARGAAGGAAVGAIAGDAGRGAAIGSVVGTVRGGRRQRMANAEAKQQAAKSASDQVQDQYRRAAAARNDQLNTFKRGFSTCMDARGYSLR